MTKYFTSKSDVPILVLSIFALLAAGVLSMVTMANKPEKVSADLAGNPYMAADMAAKDGIEAARWHIICHSRTEAGGLGTKYDINGATYKVEWGDLNTADSTVNVKSTGESRLPTNESYSLTMESKIKINNLPSHKSDIMTSYYDRNGVRQIVSR